MTEEEWLVNREPSVMILFLEERSWIEAPDAPASPHERKFRLFAIACCRHIEHLLTDQRSRDALAVIERWVEGDASDEAKHNAARTAGMVTWDLEHTEDGQLQAAYAVCTTVDDIQEAHTDTIKAAEEAANAVRNASEEAYQADLVREIFGNPFRPVAVDPAWRTFDVMALATGIYAEKAFDRMPILADALQDAGCDSDAILDHLRDPKAVHVRGCWALDLVLGKP